MALTNDTTSNAVAREALLNDPDFLRELVEVALQRFLDAEMTEHLQAAPHERSNARQGYRNGYRARQLKTRVGTLELAVPVDRDGTFRSELFERYQRSEKALGSTLMQMYLEGVSTRKVRDVTETLCGTSFSRSTVSGLVKTLDADLAAWRERPLGEVAYPFVLVDATYQHVRVAGQVVSQAALIVMGVRDDGKREILAVSVTGRESGPDYEDLFRGLRARGLRGVRLVVSDDHAGLRSAIQRNFPGVAWQRCQVHFQRNLAARVARKHRAALMADVRAAFQAPTADMARTLAFQVAERWRASHPKVAELLEDGIDACLNVYALPPHHRSRLRTTNALERLHQEIKRRTRVIRIFPNPESCLRMITSLCMEHSEEWLAGRCYLDPAALDDTTQPEQEVLAA